MTFALDADDVRDHIRIEDIIGSVISLKKTGSVLKGLCPFHDEKTASLVIWPEKQRFRCFGCSSNGDVFDFIQQHMNVDFPTAIQLMAERAGIPIPEDPAVLAQQSVWARLHALCAAAALYYQGILASHEGSSARHYLARRGITPETTQRFGLGYAPPDGEGLLAHLRSAGYSSSEIRVAGLLVHSQEGPQRPLFRERLIFPLRDRRGQVCGFSGRVLGAGRPKYLNSPATPVYTKSALLYGLDLAQEAIRQRHCAVLVEGFLDVLRAHQVGLGHVVGIAGTAITAEQMKLLRRSERVVLALDGDAAGQAATLRAGLAAQALCAQQDWPATLHVAVLPSGTDPDEMMAQDSEGFRMLLDRAPTLMDHYVAHVTTHLDRASPRWQQSALDKLLPVIRTLKGAGLQQHYLERTAALVHIDAATLRAEMEGQTHKHAPHAPSSPPQHHAVLTGPRAIPKAPDWLPPIDGTPESKRTALAAACAHAQQISEEYALGLFLAHAPLDGELLALAQSYEPGESSRAPYFAHLARGAAAPDDPAVQQLIAQAQAGPPVSDDQLHTLVRSCLHRATTERLRHLALSGHSRAMAGLITPYSPQEHPQDQQDDHIKKVDNDAD